MAKGPVQVVLNSESYISMVPQQRLPMGNKDFYANNNQLFVEHKRNIISQLDEIAVAQMENPYSKVNYIKVRMIHKALAKSHRPTGKLFTPQNYCKLIGGVHRGEMIFEVTPQSIAELKHDIEIHVEDEPILKLNKKTQEMEVAPSDWRCELGAIESVSIYSSEDKIGFTLAEAINQLENSNGCFYIELFEMPLREQLWDTLNADKLQLYNSLKEGLGSIPGVKIYKSAIRGSSNLLIMRIDNTSASSVSFHNRVKNPVHSVLPSISQDQDKYKQVFDLLTHHPLVRRVSAVPSLLNIPQPSFRIDSTELGEIPFPNKDGEYPIVAVVDNGISPIFADWTIATWDNIPQFMRDKNHGSFISGLLINGATWNPTICLEQNGCKVIDLCMLPAPGYFNRVYNHGIDTFIEELETAVSDIAASTHVRIFNLSMNIQCTRLNTEYGPLAQALDRIAEKNDIIFVISAGNLQCPRSEWLPEHKDNVLKINGRKDDIVYCPAESIRNLSVGALNPDGDGLASYSCKGKGSTFGIKPDFVHKSGCGVQDSIRGHGLFSVNKDGLLHSAAGTSFSAPLVAKTMAVVEKSISGHISRETLMALMVHNAEIPEAFKAKEYKGILDELIGYGLPTTADNILNGDEHSITLVFAGRIKSKQILSFRFAWPISLIKNNKCTGSVRVTLVSTPAIDYSFGDEMIRENISVSLRQIQEDGNKRGMLKSKYQDDKSSNGHMYEWQLIESEQKWNPIKVYEKDFPRGTENKGAWFLEVEYQSRDGNLHSLDGVPFTVIMTIADPQHIAPVYNEMRQNVIAEGAQIADIQNAVTITQRV